MARRISGLWDGFERSKVNPLRREIDKRPLGPAVEQEGIHVMRRPAWIALALTVALVASASAFGARTQATELTARMRASEVVPKKPKGNVANATGTLAGSLQGSGSQWKLSWRLTYSRLDNPSIVIADIHYGKPGHFGPVIVRLCGPCKAGQQRGTVKVKGTWVPAIKSGSAFITLITGKNPNGEIRGQIKTQ